LARLEDPTRFKLRFLGKVQVKGRQEAVAVFEVFEGDPEEIVQLKMRTRMEFETGLSLYHSKRFAEATEMFQTVLHHNSQDKTAQLYLERATRYLKDGVLADWSGVAVLTEK
jgi:two-component system sensor histidine kinase ChiS